MRITTEIADLGALRFQQASDIVLRELDGDLFLKRPHDDAVFHLNAVAAILWRLLEQPVSLATAVAALGQIFPQTAPDQIRRDVKTVFDDFQAGGLIRANHLMRGLSIAFNPLRTGGVFSVSAGLIS